MGALKDWVKQDWVRIGTDGKIKGTCGTSKDKKTPDRCLPRSKAPSLSQSQSASTAKKQKREDSIGKTHVKNTNAAEVKYVRFGGEISRKRTASKNMSNGGDVARGSGRVKSVRRKLSTGSLRS